MVKTLVKHGNSWALIIDRPILDLLKIVPDQPLEMSVGAGNSLVIRPVQDQEARMAEAIEWMNQVYAEDFRILAG